MKTVIEKCTGCSACSLVCPAKAIEMRENEKGFLQAFIDEDKCIDCGKCERICARAKEAGRSLAEGEHYVAAAKDRTILEKSSSGGIAFLLARSVIRQGGLSCGVKYDAETENARHYLFGSEEELRQSQGSRYLQSVNGPAFEEALDTDRPVIVFGTPCQIAGFREVIRERKDEERFTLVDLFCHGVPSTKLWRNHVAAIRAKYRVEGRIDPRFRKNKDFFLAFDKYFKWYNQDAFVILFLRNEYMNRSCYECPYRRSSAGDLRIGDLMSEKYGALWYSPSCICVNTSKGRALLDSIAGEAELFRIPFEEIDAIQDKGIKKDPEVTQPKYRLLNKPTVTPRELLGATYYKCVLKSFVKIPLLKISKRMGRSGRDSLEEIVAGRG